jgi:hypothetical protein
MMEGRLREEERGFMFELSARFDRRRLGRLVLIALAVTLAYAAGILVPAWLSVVIPRWAWRRMGIIFLQAMLFLYGTTVVASVTGLVVLLARRPRGGGWLLRAKGLALCLSCLFGIVLLESGAMAWQAWAHRIPDLPRHLLRPPSPSIAIKKELMRLPETSSASTEGPLRILVIGESSARGEPYHPWVSVGQILGWQLERVFPGRKVKVEVRARPGLTLEQAHQSLDGLSYRPDVLVLFSGHNEIQSRYYWDRTVPYYLDEIALATRRNPVEIAMRASPLCGMIFETLETQRLDTRPPKKVTRKLVDVPACSPEEYAGFLADFRRRLDEIARLCEQIDTLPIFIIPPSNDGGFEPNRSILPAETPRADREAFAVAVREARAAEESDPAKSIARYRGLLERQPKFAEIHFRLARLLEKKCQWDEARRHDFLAREYDAMPMRCLEVFRDAYRDVASRHASVVLVDGPKVLEAIAPHGLLNDHQFHDAHHPTLLSYIALAQNALDQLTARQALGWPRGAPSPRIDPAECVARFQIDPERWAEVCRRSGFFYRFTAYIRYDPRRRLASVERLERAIQEIEAGKAPEETGVPGLGIRPTAESLDSSRSGSVRE